MSDHDQSVDGVNDKWMLLERLTSDGRPLVVLARTGNPAVDALLQTGQLAIVHGVADADLVNDVGMPQHTDRLYPVEDGIAHELGGLGVGAVHVASISGNGERRMFYACATPLELDSIVQSLGAEGYSLSISRPTDRATLAELVTPTLVDHKLSADLSVITNLEKDGDDRSIPRPTDFWFYGAKSGLEGLVAELAPAGYVVDHWQSDPAGVQLTREMPVDFQTFREVTPALLDAAARHGVDYDGWGAPVVRPYEEEAEPQPKSFLGRLFGGKKN
jgi:hypothetical protein